MTAFDRRDLLAAGVAALGTVTLPRRGTAQTARPAASSKDSLSATLLHRAEDAWTLDREGERATFRAPNKPYAGPVRPPSAQPKTGATK